VSRGYSSALPVSVRPILACGVEVVVADLRHDFKSWALSSGAGSKTVYVQYQDRAGNLSAPVRDTIKYRP
jgi:hypothetical protein